MSFYGDIKRINSSPYVFDKVYPNRAAMNNNIDTDNIYIGRYVLVKYTCRYNGSNLEYFDKYSDDVEYTEVTADINDITYQPNVYYFKQDDKYILDKNDEYTPGRRYYTAKYVLNPEYVDNINEDLKQYKDTYDATVWQKVFTHANLNGNASYKYILVAELNAEVPDLNLKLISPKNGTMVNNNWEETWNEPSFLPAFSSVDSYTLEMPNVLHLDVSNLDENFYAKDLTNPATKYRMALNLNSGKITPTSATTIPNDERFLTPTEMMSDTYNAIGWDNLRYDKELDDYKIIAKDSQHTGPIDGKQLNMKLYAFGQMLSDLYDVMYGVPKKGSGPRPFYTQELADVLSNYDKGLVGVLTSIATEAHGDASQDCYERTIKPGMHYYFNVKWTDAYENPDNFIENIPRVVGSSDERSNDRAHYNYNFILCKYEPDNIN